MATHLPTFRPLAVFILSRCAVVLAVLTLVLSWSAGMAADRPTSMVEVPPAIEPRRLEVPAADPLGRQLHDATHSMDMTLMGELQRRVPKYAELDHAAIMRNMSAMGPNYTWYISDLAVTGNTGVLVLAHGFRDRGDRIFVERLQPVAGDYPTALALGMSMMGSDHIQLALNNLAATGVSEVIVVPAVSTRYNTMLRQWEYVFGLRDEPEYAAVPRVRAPVALRIAPPLDDHPLVAEVLIEYAAEISSDPAREEVIIVAHGPVHEADNMAQLAMLEGLAQYVREHADYAAVSVATLQDDAVKAVREANVARLRERLQQAAAAGREVLIVTNLLGTYIVQSQLRRDLRGLDYRFNSKGLVQHENFIRWIEQSVAAGQQAR